MGNNPSNKFQDTTHRHLLSQGVNRRSSVGVLLLLLCSIQTLSQGDKPLVSPRLLALQKELEVGNIAALETFWQEIGKQGAPLIEPIFGDEHYSLITFIWRAREETKNVGVFSGIAGIALEQNRMTRLRSTDLWFRSYRVRNDARFAYKLSVNDPFDKVNPEGTKAMELRRSTFKTDPLNPHGISGASMVELPDAPPQHWITKQADVPTGRIESKKMKSAILGNERDIGIYTPPSYKASGSPYGLLILFDGDFYISDIPMPTILDNLLAKKKLPPLVAIVVGNPTDDSRNTELPCNANFAEFVSKELMPWVRQHYYVTTDRTRTVIGGASYGGLAATFAAFRHPEIFGNVISQSGAYWWKPDFLNPKDDREYEWLTKQLVASPKLPIRFYLDIGLMEADPTGAQGDGPSMVVVNRHLRDVLRAKGYIVHYHEFNGDHTFLNWRGTLPDALLRLTGNDGKIR